MANLSLALCSIHREGMNARVTPCTPPHGLVCGFLEAGGQTLWCQIPSAQWWGRPAHQPVPLSSTPHGAHDNRLFSTLVTPLLTGQVGAERPRDARQELCPLPSLFSVSKGTWRFGGLPWWASNDHLPFLFGAGRCHQTHRSRHRPAKSPDCSSFSHVQTIQWTGMSKLGDHGPDAKGCVTPSCGPRTRLGTARRCPL